MSFKWFGNDEDGLTLSDVVGIIVITLWVIVTSYLVYVMLKKELTCIMIDFYSVFLWLPLLVVGSLFGESVISVIGRGKLPSFSLNKKKSIQEEADKNGCSPTTTSTTITTG